MQVEPFLTQNLALLLFKKISKGTPLEFLPNWVKLIFVFQTHSNEDPI
jgi:hypothetical protein